MEKGMNPGLGLAILRVVIGVIFITHGVPKVFGGMEGTAGFFGQLGIPLPLVAAWFIALLESLGGLALIAGIAVLPISLLLAVHMLAGIVLVHAAQGWYVLGAGTGGVEFNVLLIAGLLALILAGPGMAAVDGRRQAGT
ncbi:MAG: DoxX family protein [Gemmatimonadota bacterium]|nr:DoxX family protein [Gemmatimonadota bacterium]